MLVGPYVKILQHEIVDFCELKIKAGRSHVCVQQFSSINIWILTSLWPLHLLYDMFGWLGSQ